MFHFPRFLIFSPYTDPRVYISHFSCFSLFLAIFQVLPCEFLSFLLGNFSRHIQGHTVFVFHFPRFSVFSPYSRSNSVCVSFSLFFNFLSIIQVLQCYFSFFMFSQFLAILEVPQCVFLILQGFLCFLPLSRS